MFPILNAKPFYTVIRVCDNGQTATQITRDMFGDNVYAVLDPNIAKGMASYLYNQEHTTEKNPHFEYQVIEVNLATNKITTVAVYPAPNT